MDDERIKQICLTSPRYIDLTKEERHGIVARELGEFIIERGLARVVDYTPEDSFFDLTKVLCEVVEPSDDCEVF